MSKITRNEKGHVEVTCGGRNCTATDFTVELDWRKGLHALDWRYSEGEWYCPLCLHTDYTELRHGT